MTAEVNAPYRTKPGLGARLRLVETSDAPRVGADGVAVLDSLPDSCEPLVVRGSRPARWLKRAIDVGASAALLAVIFPVMAVVGAAVAVTSRGPVLYLHDRVGRNGERFTCYKFRTMVPGADRQLINLLTDDPELDAQFREGQKLRRDPRVTRVGRVLRTTSLDELPQLFNVLKGDMSLVGPRPLMPDELVERYGSNARQLLTVAPGLTGPWQVSGRNNLSYAERVRLDVEYSARWTLRGDLRLLAKTTGVLAKPHENGAC